MTVRMKVLLLVHRLPYPPNKGDKVRSYHLLRHLAREHEVYLGTFVDDPDDWQHLPEVRRLCADVHAAGLKPSAAKLASLRGLLTGEALSLPYYRDAGLQAWVADLRAGKDGPRGRDFNMRWLAAAVGELHRILLKGGLFIYPADARKGYENGRLRLVYECVPIAFLIEQAGGLASDGTQPIRYRKPLALHDMTPLVFGAKDEVETVLDYLSGPRKG
jgi:hypothetical protein